jgi:hypothetical protein
MELIVGLGSNSWLGEESQDLVHEALALIGVKEKLRVGGAFEEHEFFGFWCSIELCLDTGETKGSLASGVIAREDKKLSTREFLRLRGWCRQEHKAVDLVGDGDICLCRGPTTEAGTNDRDARGTGLLHVFNGCNNIEIGIIAALILRPTYRFASPSEVDGDDLEASVGEEGCLVGPAFFGEATAVREDERLVAGAVEIGVDDAAVGCWEGDGARGGAAEERKGCEDKKSWFHEGIVHRRTLTPALSHKAAGEGAG